MTDMTDIVVRKIKETIITEIKSYFRTDEEIENDMKPYDVDHMYEYGQQAGMEQAIKIIENTFKDFGF